MRIMCQLKENMENDEQIIYMITTSFIYKEEYNITINYKATKIKVKQLKSDISFLYSSKQEIDIKDNENNYELVFKQFKYNNRPLFLYKNDIRELLLENCISQMKEVTCTVDKNKLLEILAYSGESFSLAEKLDTDDLYIFNTILGISFNNKIIQKYINIKIGKLLTSYVSKNEFIAYEIDEENNITNSFTTDYFDIGTDENSKMYCVFKKSYNHNKIFLLCNATNEGKNTLGKITPFAIYNLHVLYIFLIDQSESNEEFEVSSNEGAKITSLTPLLLNFTEKNNISIIYETQYPEKISGIKLNNLSPNDLECTDKPWHKECLVNKAHFQKSGYYYTLHSNHKGTKTISYEAPMIYVIVKEEPSPEPEEKGPNYGLLLLGFLFLDLSLFV